MLTAAIASARGAPTLAVGNVIGTNVTIATAALGLSALIFPMIISDRVRRQAVITTLVSVLPVVLLFLGMVTQLEGVLLLVVFVGYTIFLFRTDREAVKRLAAMAVGGPAIVEGALRLARLIGISKGAVGATIVSLGTGAEMIALGVSAARKKTI